MTSKANKITIYLITITISVLIFFLSISAPIVVNESDYSIYNSDWNGCSDLAVKTREIGRFAPNIELAENKRTEVTQKDLTEYEVEPKKTGLMIIGPRQEFSQASIEFVDSFLQEGGKMVLADDFGSGNSLLDRLDTNSSFYSSPLFDLAFEKKPEFGVAYNTTEHNMTADVSHVRLNSPTAIDKDDNASTILSSSEASWLDQNENSIKDESERFKQYPLVTTEDYGEGELILVSDPSIFINSMLDKDDNRVFSENILQHLSRGRSDIIFDESHREMSFIYRIVYIGDVPTTIIGALLLIAGLGIGIYSIIIDNGKDIFREMSKLTSYLIREEEEEKGVVGKVLNNHPDWNKDKLKMINERFIEEKKGDG
ncbi:MAG: DUF4350 domain-containing protein [Candidatus Thermoplasmatota archaeon]